jgi:hypothetical protein
MKNDSPPWKEDPNNPTRKSSEKRKDKYGNEIKNVAKHLARKAMNSVKEAVNKKSRKKDWTGATIDKDRFVLPEEVEHENCGTPECCGQCDPTDLEELGENNDMPKGLQDRSPRGRARNAMGRAIAKQERNLARARMDRAARKMEEEAEQVDEVSKNLMLRYVSKAKQSAAVSTPKTFVKRMRGTDMAVRKYTATDKKYVRVPATEEVELDESVDKNHPIVKEYTALKKHDIKTLRGMIAKSGGVVDTSGFKSKDHAASHLIRSKHGNKKVDVAFGFNEETEGKVYSVHVKGDSAQHNSPEFKKHLAGWGGEKHYTSDKGAAYKFKKEYQANGFHHGVGSMFKKLDSEHDGHVNEEVEQINEYGIDQNAHSVSAGYTPKTPPKTKPIAKPTMHPAAEKPRTPQSSVGSLSRIRGAMAKRVNNNTVKEELGKSNEWGTDALRKKYAAMTPGQEGLAAKNIPTFDARYDDVPTKYCGGIQKEETLSEISARGVAVRDDFRKKIQKAINDPANIARAKKVLAKKKAQQKVADANAPKNLVHQLHKSQSINAKVKFYDGKEHEIAPNHHDKFMNKYHGMKSSIEKEALVNRAHKSHDEFLKAIHEEWADFSQEKPNTDSINPANYPTPPIRDDMTDYNSDDRHDEYDAVAIENDVASEIENAEWEDLVDYYEDEDLDYQDSEEDIAEGITPQGRLKKRFNMMRTKGRRNLARNMALKRVATPDRIKSRSVRAARNMVYSRVLRGRDRSSLSASEKSRIEGMVKRMAPMVGRLSIRLQQKERMIDRKRINNRNKTKKK